MTSCSSEEEALMPSGDGVSFTINIPGNISTRGTFGDGTDAGDRATLDNLQWTVFEVGTDGVLTEVFSDSKDAFALSQTEETVTISLAKGKTYQVAFYADDKDNRFATYANGNVSVNYDNAASNRASEDVFIGKSDVFTVEGSFNKTVTLTRPFAQLNWRTDDTAEQSIVPLIASLTGQVTISNGLYSKMNVVSDEVSEAVTTPVTFGAVKFNALPTNTFPVEKTDGTAPYALIAMNYLLTGDGTIDCELGLNNGLSAVTVNAAPVKVNYRTNIYGSLLTSPGMFNIIVDNDFGTPDNNKEVVSIAASNAVELLAAVRVAGSDITLTEDIEIPSGSLNLIRDVAIDLNGHTLKTAGGSAGDAVLVQNAKITLKNGKIVEPDNYQTDAGLITLLKGADVTLENMELEGGIPVYILSSGSATDAQAPKVTIKSGSYTTTTNSQAVYVQRAGKVVIEGGTFAAAWGTYVDYVLNLNDSLLAGGADPRSFIEVKGGTFINYNPAASKSENPVANFVAEGYESVQIAGTDNYEVRKK